MNIFKRPSNKVSGNPKENSVVHDIRFLFDVAYIRFLFLFSLILRIFFHSFFHPSTPSTFAPDEGTYARLSEYVSKGLAVQNFPEYGPFLYNQSKSLIIPSSVFIRLGFDSLESVRLVSTIYGLCLPILALLCFIALRYSANFASRNSTELSSPLAFFLVIVVFFMPSNFLWSTLGLRESASQFWLLAQTYFLIKLVLNKKGKNKTLFILFILATAFSFASRPQTALLYSLLVFCVTLIVAAKRYVFMPVAAVILSIVLGNAYSATPKVNYSISWALNVDPKSGSSNNKLELPVDQSSKSSQDSSEELRNMANKVCSVVGQKVEIDQLEYLCSAEIKYKKASYLPPITSFRSNVDSSLFEERRNGNRIGASSALAPSNCSQSTTSVSTLLCNIREIPYRLSAFLFRPFLLLDNGSSFLTAAGVENVIWLLLFFIAFALLFRLDFLSNSIPSILSISFFIILFSTAAALYEGNMGTAFRHKSTILCPLVLLLLLLLVSQKREIRREKT